MSTAGRSGTVAAVDLGATSGRVMLGHVGPGELRLVPVARFPNTPVRTPDGLHWNILELYRSIIAGLSGAAKQEPHLASIGIDSWAVDYGLLRQGRLLGAPFHYRDERTAAGVEAVHGTVPFADLYRVNGLQFLPFNTVYQLATERDAGMLDVADTALLVPDLIAHWLTGARVAEATNASTTGLVRAGEPTRWDAGLLTRLGIPAAVVPPIVQPGDRIGTLLEAVAAEVGLPSSTPVTAIGSHDTASAVVAVPMTTPDAAYISCGTWGLVGVELERPVLTEASRAANFTNEGGVDGRTRFLHNVMGLWLLSESVRTWERGGETIDLPGLIAQAAAVDAPVSVFDANDPRFLAPGDLPARIAEFLIEHGRAVPQSRAEFVRCIIESLAQAFADAVHTASELSGVQVRAIHVVGGGSQNTLLCQLTADRAEIPVIAGPVEATALGNVLVQARAVGIIDGDLETLRALVARSFDPTHYEPRKPAGSTTVSR
ncbi:rhamnulokinase family protein [Plantibacter sp. VKM Ac-2876]|uniref:rhamnulokinase n=1 Tax=Plantibacter sp. VKM Ac-2876 TaxID=2783826 RepID=UPI00188D28C1|nr:rhamnulokinase family protein [Plantibacter sp. VKM Ac-2876]MBF4565947.1 rhamnulokinase [Plantibacter sp. VKM Ac-2876]